MTSTLTTVHKVSVTNQGNASNAAHNVNVANQNNESTGAGAINSTDGVSIPLAPNAIEATTSMPQLNDVANGIQIHCPMPQNVGGQDMSQPSPHSVVNSNKRITPSSTQPYGMPFSFMMGLTRQPISTSLGASFWTKFWYGWINYCHYDKTRYSEYETCVS